MTDRLVHTFSSMATVITIEVVGHGAGEAARRDRASAVDRAASWFSQIHVACTRFNPQSELRQVSERVGVPCEVSPLLFEAVRFAIAVAEETGGAFDPTVGHGMETRGFDEEYTTGNRAPSGVREEGPVSFRDVDVDVDSRTVTLRRPLVLDLGAVVKGLAIDLAARELQPFADFAIDAGGDLYLGGHNAEHDRWAVGIRHPRANDELLTTLHLTDIAVCTSGDYERATPLAGEHHIVDPRTGASPKALASVTVLAPSAMVADALATAAFVLGPAEGLHLLERHGAEGLLVTRALERFTTPGMRLE